MAASKRGREIARPRQQQQVTHRKVYPVTKGLKSVETEKQYKWHFDAFLKWLGLRYKTEVIDEMLLDWDIKELENLIIEYLDEYLHKKRNLKRSTINGAMAAIVHFCEVNDIWDINRKKISMFVPQDEDHKEDRAYTRKEVERLIKESDKRFRVVFLLLTNSLRIGAIPGLRLGDLTPISINDDPNAKPQKVYQIWVYNRSKRGRYYTYVTPEASEAIDDYLKWRKEETHEDITNPDSPLIREQWSLSSPRADVAIPREMSQSSLEKSIERIVKRSGIKTNGQVMLTHGMRKYAITMMKQSGVDFSDREYLVGHRHSRGLDVNYDRTTEEERLVSWSRAINKLTINPAFYLTKELEIAKGEMVQEIARLKAEKREQDLKVQEVVAGVNELAKKDKLKTDLINEAVANTKKAMEMLESTHRENIALRKRLHQHGDSTPEGGTYY